MSQYKVDKRKIFFGSHKISYNNSIGRDYFKVTQHTLNHIKVRDLTILSKLECEYDTFYFWAVVSVKYMLPIDEMRL